MGIQVVDEVGEVGRYLDGTWGDTVVARRGMRQISAISDRTIDGKGRDDVAVW